jgi:predicted ATPase/DNA-binding winged helix-turn-helix (wHTH) protein
VTAPGASVRYRFGRFELQPDERRLLAAGTPVHLGPHALDLLTALAVGSGHLVTKDELLRRVWGKVIGAENTLQAHISALRKVLGADSIATVSGRGYRFTLEVSQFGAAATEPAPAPKHNLPHDLTSFIGREKEIAELAQLLASARLLTLTGSGGCGKTRLAIQLARRQAHAYPDGAWLVELAALTDAALLPQAVANVLGIKERPGARLIDTIAEYLAPRALLLVLDNAEHLIEPCAQLAESLLQRCGRLVVLATSRERLRITGEQTYRVPSLSVPDEESDTTPESIAAFESARLFIERARLQQPNFAITTQNSAAVASICRRLDGIALALELAAPRVRTLPVEELSRHLDRRFEVLTEGSRTALPRHRTLRALIDWSYDLLSDAEQAMLRRLSVFSGGWRLEAVAQICSGDDVQGTEMLDLLTSLVDKNLVLAEASAGPTRYGLLETVRDYARGRLTESGEEERVKRRHLECYVKLVEEVLEGLRGAQQQAGLDRLETEHDNLRSALAWCATPGGDAVAGLRLVGTLAWFWSVRGYLGEGRDWLEKMLSAAPSVPPTSLRARALVGAGVIVAQLGDDAAAKRFYEEGLAIYKEVGDRSGEGYALRSLANVAFAQADYPTARAQCEESLEIARELGDWHTIASLLGTIGEAAGKQGDYPTARRLLEECLTMARDTSDRWLIGWTLGRLGAVAYAEMDYSGARELFKEALTMLCELHDQWGLASALEGLAPVALALAGPRPAARIWGGAERLREEVSAAMPPTDRQPYEVQVASARAALGDDAAFDIAWSEGRAMSMDQAVKYALELDAGGDKMR